MTARALRYGSVCSGMEAATSSWHPLGWQPQFFSEIDATASRFLAVKYPHVPNHGDMTKFKEWPDHAIDLLVGGTPCQSFSVAGLRKGLADPRGNLMLTYLAIAERYRPRWLAWENVPGVLSSWSGDDPPSDLVEGQEWETEETSDFGCFLAGLQELGYGFAYRVLDAQYVRVESHPRAVPQRRRRVFVVGCLGSWQRAAAVLFERESLSGHPAPRREAGQGIARGIEIGPSGGGFTDVNPTLDCRAKDGPIRNQLAGAVISVTPAYLLAFGEYGPGQTASTMKSRDWKDATDLVAHSLKAEGYDASEDGTGRGTPIVPVAYCTAGDGAVYEEGDKSAPLTTGTDASANIIAIQERAVSENPDSGPQGAGFRQDGAAYTLEARNKVQAVAYGLATSVTPKFGIDVSPTLTIPSPTGGGQPAAVAYDLRGREGGAQFEVPPDTANIRAANGGSSRSYVQQTYAVRRLTPLECTRLQGFPDDYFECGLNKPLSDGAKYKLLGNSKANNVVTWIGERIALIDALDSRSAA